MDTEQRCNAARSDGARCLAELGHYGGHEWPEPLMSREEPREAERKRIACFLRAVYENSTGGASHLMDRAIEAVERNDMDDPVRVANDD